VVEKFKALRNMIIDMVSESMGHPRLLFFLEGLNM